MKTEPAVDARRQGLDARRSLSRSDRHRASRQIAATFVRTHEFVAAQRIACYLPMADEVDPGRIIARAWCAEKEIYVPVVTSGHAMSFTRLTPDSVLTKNRFDIWEPDVTEVIAPRDLDLVVTPLVAFDSRANRIGMGGGFYDRQFDFLARRQRWRRPKLFGVAFACQQVTGITPNPWDVRLYGVVTETCVLRQQA